MTVPQNEYNKLMKSVRELALKIQDEISSVSKSLEKINTHLDNSISMDIDLIPEEGIKRINDDLNQILFLEDMLINDINLIGPTASQLADKAYWMKDKIFWMTEISDSSF